MAKTKTIKEIMKAANMTQRELANRLGVSQPAVAGMLDPKGNPRLNTLRKIARALDVDISTLIAGYDDPTTEDLIDQDPWE